MNLFRNIKNKLSLGKKGQLMSGPMGYTVSAVFGLFFVGVLIFAFALSGSEMLSATTDTTAKSVINQTVSGAENFANFSPTLWIMVAVAALIGILIGGVGIYFLGRN